MSMYLSRPVLAGFEYRHASVGTQNRYILNITERGAESLPNFCILPRRLTHSVRATGLLGETPTMSSCTYVRNIGVKEFN